MDALAAVIPQDNLTTSNPKGWWRIPFPFSLRGTLLLALTLYLLIVPARLEADIVAATTAYSLAALLVVLLIGTIVQSALLKRKVLLEINHSIGIERFESGRTTTLVLKLPRLSIAPGFLLTLRPRFQSSRIALPEFRLTGHSKGSRFLTYSLSFPHRGIWSIDQVSVGFGDQLGLTQIRWELFGENIQRRFTVLPPQNLSGALPIISSCERPGDLLTHTQERHGDPFDIRQYHPSDGARRILWKVFARRGELVSRHPEASMTPEGQVVIFAPVLPDEDHVCSAVLDYTAKLKELDLGMFCGCVGMDDASTARTPEETEKLLVDSVWNSDGSVEAALQSAQGFIDGVKEWLRNEDLRRIIVFTSFKRFRSSHDALLMERLAHALATQGISPIFFVIDSTDNSTESGLTQLKAAQRGRLPELMYRWFAHDYKATTNQTHSGYREFLATCARRNWEVIKA